ncbi:MAG TPA: S9 family peptidase [Telluria sp.]|nr:S9 family peptidase [Telluria sp.]
MHFRTALLGVLLAASLPAVHAADALIPVESFVEERQFGQPRLSPDGKHIALNVRIKRGDRTVPTMTVYTLPELQVVSTIAMPNYEIPINFAWISNRRLVLAKGLELGLRERPVATGEVVALDFDGSKQEYLYGYKGFKQSSRGDRYGDDHGKAAPAHVPQARDGHVFLGTHEWTSNHSLLYDVNTGNAARKLLADIPMKDLGFLFQNDAKPRFAYGDDDNNYAVLFRRDDASGEWRKVDPATLGAFYHPFAFTPDNSAVYASQSDNGGPSRVVRDDMQTGQRTVVAPAIGGDVDIVEFSAAPRVPFAVASTTGIPKARYLNDSAPDAILHKTLSAQFPDAYVHFVNFTDDGQKLLFEVQSDRDPGSYYVFDKQTGKAAMLFANMPLIDSDQMAERKPVSFAARDGVVITGYLTVPKNPGNKRLPMVLLPHGGPFDIKDEWYFDDDSQFLASRGYAVLQVNFRGSGGRGVGFRQAGFRQWGGKILDDLIDGVKWANGRADIDPARVCVYGISYGGYAALMLPVREPAMFKCSVGYAGRYDMITKYDQRGIKGDTRLTNYLIRTMGDDPAVLAANSPSRLADQIKVPVLLIHGAKDKTTDIEQANAMREALTRAGRPPEWLMFEREGHGFYDSEHRKEVYQRLEAFLAKHIGPK